MESSRKEDSRRSPLQLKPDRGKGREEVCVGRKDFPGLVREYTGMVYRLAHRILGAEEDAKDVVQETFTKVYRHFSEISANKNPRNWIYTIGLNTARDIYRRNARHVEFAISDQIESENSTFNANTSDNSRLAERILAVLSLEMREVTVLFYLEGHSVADISKLLKISESLVKVRLHRARQKILKTFGDHV